MRIILVSVFLMFLTSFAEAGEMVYQDMSGFGQVVAVEKTNGSQNEYYWYLGGERYLAKISAEVKRLLGKDGNGLIHVKIDCKSDSGDQFDAQAELSEKDRGKFGTVTVTQKPFNKKQYWTNMMAGYGLFDKTFQHWFSATNGAYISYPSLGLKATPRK